MEVSEKGNLTQIPNLVKLETGLKTGGNRRQATGAFESGRDKVYLSPRAREVEAAKQKMMNMPDIRTEIVSDIRKRIYSGTYMVKDDQIAFRMLQESVLNQKIIA